ncbi:MAG TPA: hypothetical protein VER96_35720 [Polyangiaceae bacterium]|nr:hypothetical protein [Polyangiaceae bacterium]
MGAVFCTPTARAATLRVQGGGGSIQKGETRSLDLILDLSPTERASVFEGRFQLIGADNVDAQFASGSSSWTSSVGRYQTGQINLSLTSNNAGGSRVLGTLKLTGKQLGNVRVQLQGPSLVAADTSVAPFTSNLTLDTQVGTTLASFSVVGDGGSTTPAPATTAAWVALLCGALCAIAMATLRRRAGGG